MIRVRFYAELNQFLEAGPPERQIAGSSAPAVRTLIEQFGVPPEAVDLVLVDGEPVSLEHPLTGGERVALYPVFERFNISSITRVRAQALRNPRFLLDAHLGKLARRLRLLGFDAEFDAALAADGLIRAAAAQGRIIVTRNRSLADRRAVTHLCLILSEDPGGQLEEILDILDLRQLIKPFSRCMECNSELRPASDPEIAAAVPLRVMTTLTRFLACPDCARVYWEGTHYERMKKLIETVREKQPGR